MIVLSIIVFSLSIIFLGLEVGLDFTKYSKYSTHIRCAYYVTVFITALISFLSSFRGVNNNVLISCIIIISMLFLYEGFNIYNLYSTKLTKYKDKIEVYSALSIYVILFISLTIYYGFNFVELIVSSILAIIFYLSIYVIKRKETANQITKFFIYAIIISLVVGLSFTGFILSSKGSDTKIVFLFNFIGLILIYLSSLVRHANIIFEYYPNKNYIVYDKVTYFMFNLGMTFIAFSLLFIFY